MRFVVICLIAVLLMTVVVRANTATLTITCSTCVADFVKSFNVYKSTTSNGYDFTKPLGNVLMTSSGGGTYVDTVDNSANFFYVVKAVGSTGLLSPASNEVVANPLPPRAPGVGLAITPQTAQLLINNKPVASGPVGDRLDASLSSQGKPTTFLLSVVYSN